MSFRYHLYRLQPRLHRYHQVSHPKTCWFQFETQSGAKLAYWWVNPLTIVDGHLSCSINPYCAHCYSAAALAACPAVQYQMSEFKKNLPLHQTNWNDEWGLCVVFKKTRSTMMLTWSLLLWQIIFKHYLAHSPHSLHCPPVATVSITAICQNETKKKSCIILSMFNPTEVFYPPLSNFHTTLKTATIQVVHSTNANIFCLFVSRSSKT